MKKIVYGLALVCGFHVGALFGMESEEVFRSATGAWQELAEKINNAHTITHDMLNLPTGWAGEKATRALESGQVSLTNDETKEVLEEFQKSLMEYVEAINAFFNDSERLMWYQDDSVAALNIYKAIVETLLQELDELERRLFGEILSPREIE